MRLGKAGDGKALQTGHERGPHSQVSCSLRGQQDPKNPAAAAELPQWLSLIPKIPPPASRKGSILIIPPTRATINKLKVLEHLICCLHLKLPLEGEQHKVKLLPKAAH